MNGKMNANGNIGWLYAITLEVAWKLTVWGFENIVILKSGVCMYGRQRLATFWGVMV